MSFVEMETRKAEERLLNMSAATYNTRFYQTMAIYIGLKGKVQSYQCNLKLFLFQPLHNSKDTPKIFSPQCNPLNSKTTLFRNELTKVDDVVFAGTTEDKAF